MLSAALLASVLNIGFLPGSEDELPQYSTCPSTGLACSCDDAVPFRTPNLMQQAPVIGDELSDECQNFLSGAQGDSLAAELASWPNRLVNPRRPRPLPCWCRPARELLPSFTMPCSINEFLASCQDSTCACISDGNLRICRDYEHFYGGPTLIMHAVAIGVAGAIANTSADQRVANWYQRDVRSAETDRWAKTGKTFGEPLMFGVYGGMMVLGKLTENTYSGSLSYEFSERSFRAIAVGAPALLAVQNLLGASRPIEPYGSHWHGPLKDDNSASGHAFLGAIPFLTAASMTENRMLRASLCVASTWTAWSRVNDNAHYLSQAMLGWYLAYQAVQSVNRTEFEERQVHILPFIHPEGTGLAVQFRY